MMNSSANGELAVANENKQLNNRQIATNWCCLVINSAFTINIPKQEMRIISLHTFLRR